MSLKTKILLGVLVVVFVVLANTLYVVKQTEQAIVLRFGEPVRIVNPYDPTAADPGLKVKVPFLENVVKFDRRNMNFQVDKEEIIAADQERLVVDAFMRWRIKDPLRFYQAVRDMSVGRDRMQPMVNSSLREVLGKAPANEIISGQRAELMLSIAKLVNQQTLSARLGVDIIDVRVKRVDLPLENSQAVYRRMITERQQEAAEIRAGGEERKREIMAEADKTVTVTLATAQEEAQIMRGVGDAARAKLFAQSFGKDPEFAGFYRSLQAYEAAVEPGTQVLISPDSAFFNTWRNGN